MSTVISEDVESERNVAREISTWDDGSKCRQPRNEDEGDLKFDPPVYRQRYQVVGEMVKKYDAKKVIDFGCAEGKLMRYLINHTSVEELTGIDIDEDLLKENKFRFQPLISDYLHRRPRPLRVSTYKGSIAETDRRFCDCDLMACIEIIEHLEPAVLDAMPAAVFGCLSPRVAIVTTPNVEFNVLFPGLQGFRHWDHKFEWTRAEFEDWARTQATKYNYRVSFHGVGAGGEGTEHLGCVSQMALFEREGYFNGEMLSGMEEPYILVNEVHYPYQIRILSEEEKVMNEVEYLLWSLSNPTQAEHEVTAADGQCPENGVFMLDRLMEFSGMKKLCGSADHLRSFLKSSGTYNLNEDESAVLWCRPESWSSNEAEDEVEWDVNDNENTTEQNTYSKTESEECEPECWDSDIETHTWSTDDFATQFRLDEEEEEEEEVSEGHDDFPDLSIEQAARERCFYDCELSGVEDLDRVDSDSSLVDGECDGDGLVWIEVADNIEGSDN